MKPIETLEVLRGPDGSEIRLTRRDGVYRILVDGLELMSSSAHDSEAALARLGCAEIAHRPRPRVLVGGLGMGYTLRAALDLLPPAAVVEVVELLPAVLRWNAGPLAELAGRPLEDPRVQVREGDVGSLLSAEGPPYDAVLLDVDNGPLAMTLVGNEALYVARGLATIRGRLTAGGVLAVWSAFRDQRFEERLRGAGFAASRATVASRPDGKGPRRTIFLARVPAAGVPGGEATAAAARGARARVGRARAPRSAQHAARRSRRGLV